MLPDSAAQSADYAGTGSVRAWVAEFRRRWPLLVGILRGKTVVYAAHLDGSGVGLVLTVENSHGAVIQDVLITGAQVGMRLDAPNDRGAP